MSIEQRLVRIPRRLVADERGAFIKCIDGKESDLPRFTGEVYICRAHPGQVRGNHYHHRATEWFTVVAGMAVLALQDPSTGERLDVPMDASRPETVRVPPGLAHVFLNPADSNRELVLVAYTDVLYDPADTIPHTVLSPQQT